MYISGAVPCGSVFQAFPLVLFRHAASDTIQALS
jgi:hypothetical protein